MEQKQSVFRGILEWWKPKARKIGDFQARLVLIFFYFVIAAPFALLVRASDPLAFKAGAPRGWRPRGDVPAQSLEHARRQF